MDSTNRVSAKFSTKIKPVQEINSEFTLCKCYVQACGKNRNFTYMDKDKILKALPTLNYAPVVGHLFKDDEGNYHLGGHDYTVDENWNFVALTVPFGVVKADSFDFEIINEYGTDVEYLTADIIMWTGRYTELKDVIYSEDVWFNESMEINVKQYRPLEEDSNYTELLDWEYSALCLLGKSDNPDENVEPCFINSSVQPYKFELSGEFTETFSEMKKAISVCFECIGGENKVMTEERIAEILAEYEVSKDAIDFEITNEMTEDDLRAKLDEFKCGGGKDKKKFEEVEVADEVTEITEEKEEIVDETVEEENVPEAVDYCVEYGKLKMEYDALKAEFDAVKADNESLCQFKADIEKAERANAEAEIFAKFDDKLSEIADYAALKEHSAEYDLKALEKECYALVGMYSVKNEVPTETSLKFSVEKTPIKAKPYGDVFEKYTNK